MSVESMSVADLGAAAGDNPTAFDAPEPTSNPDPLSDTVPTGELVPEQTSEAAPTNDPTEEPSGAPDTYSLPTSDSAAPVEPTLDAPPSTPDQTSSGSDTGSSDTTAASTAPGPVDQTSTQDQTTTQDVTTQDVSSPSATEVSAAPTATQEPVAPVTDVATVPAENEEAAATSVDDESARARSAARAGRGLSPLQILRALMLTSGSSAAGKSTAPTLLDLTGQVHSVGAASAVGTVAAPAGSSPITGAAEDEPAAMPEGLKTFLHACGQVVVAVSLSALFVAALPYLAGLVLPTLAGTHLGYRQAKAARALRGSGIAHLAPTGPIGIVRSGSLVAVGARRRFPERLPTEARVQDVA
jgi:hypothetical protein